MFIGATPAQLNGDAFTLTFEGSTTASITYSSTPATTATNITTAWKRSAT